MGEPLFNLVRVDNIETTEGLNYSPTTDQGKYHDEIQLVDPDGHPCAVPVSQGFTDMDARLDYIDGSSSQVKRALRHQIVLDIDYIDSDVWRKLNRWMMDRAKVYFTPGFGRHTELAWRPVPDTSGSFADLTGRYTLNVTGDPARNLFWDDFLGQGVMRGAGYGNQRIVKTPGGAGQIFERAHTNLADPAYPTAADLGWAIGASGATSMTTTHVPDAFGHADCPDAMRVVRSAYTGTSYIFRQLTTSTGDGTINAAVWLKGQLPPGSMLRIYDSNAGTMIASVALDTSYPDWTRVDIQAITTLSGLHDIRIVHWDAGHDTTADYLVGPTVFVEEITSSQYSQPNPQWQTPGAAKSADLLQTSAPFAQPRAGTYFAVFYVPEWFEELDSALMSICGPVSGLIQAFYLTAYNANTNLRAIFYYKTGSAIGPNIGGLINPGEINTACATFANGSVSMYINGDLVQSLSTSDTEQIETTSNYLRIGYAVGRGSWPLLMTHLRIDNEVWSADRVANEHETHSNPGALEVVVASRGRQYMIREIPSQPFLAAGKSYMRGRLVLEQVDYNKSIADITSSEE